MSVGPIAAVRVWTTDLGVARRFYGGQLGLDETWSSDGVATFATGSAQLVVEQVQPGDEEGEALVGRFVGVSFTVGDVGAVVAQLAAAGVPIVGEPEAQPWGATLAHVADPDGNVLTLVELPDAP